MSESIEHIPAEAMPPVEPSEAMQKYGETRAAAEFAKRERITRDDIVRTDAGVENETKITEADRAAALKFISDNMGRDLDQSVVEALLNDEMANKVAEIMVRGGAPAVYAPEANRIIREARAQAQSTKDKEKAKGVLAKIKNLFS